MKINFLITLIVVTTIELCQGYGYAKQHLTTNNKQNKFWTGHGDVRLPTTPIPAKRRVVRGVFFYTYDDNFNGKEIEMHELNSQTFNKLILSNEFVKSPGAVKSTFDLISFFDGRCEASISCKREIEYCTERPCECTTTPIPPTPTTSEKTTTTPQPTTTSIMTTHTPEPPPPPSSPPPTTTRTPPPPPTSTPPPTTTRTPPPPPTTTPHPTTTTPPTSTPPISKVTIYTPPKKTGSRTFPTIITRSYPRPTWTTRSYTYTWPTKWTRRSTRKPPSLPPTTSTRYFRFFLPGNEQFEG